MKYVLYDYQKFTTDFILSHPVAAILLQIDPGKSVITLTALKHLFDRKEIFRALVIDLCWLLLRLAGIFFAGREI